jgi:tRNA A37 threonylcarbamoyladenosine biosynthesis protein TsaE
VQTYYDNETEATRAKGTIWHVDLFRTNSLSDVFMLDLEEAIYKHVCLIEWPERIVDMNISNKIDVYLSVTSESTRSIAVRYT